MKSTKQITINCKATHLWEVLTSPEYSKEYMYSCAVQSSWIEGEAVTWSGFVGDQDVFLKGVLLKFQPYQIIKFSTFDPNIGLEDVEANYIHITYTIHELNNESQLTITNETFDGSLERMAQVNKGWDFVIEKIKEVAEA